MYFSVQLLTDKHPSSVFFNIEECSIWPTECKGQRVILSITCVYLKCKFTWRSEQSKYKCA